MEIPIITSPELQMHLNLSSMKGVYGKSLYELCDVVIQQMTEGAFFSDYTVTVPIPDQPISDSGMMLVGPTRVSDETHYDTFGLLLHLYESIGEFLAQHHSVEDVQLLNRKMNGVYKAIDECEKQVEDKNKKAKKRILSMDVKIPKIFKNIFRERFFTKPHSIGIKASQLLLNGYCEDKQGTALEEEIKNLFYMTALQDESKVDELVESSLRVPEAAGQMIRANTNDTLAWKISFLRGAGMYTPFSDWSSNLDKAGNTNLHRKVEEAYNSVFTSESILGGYFHKRYGWGNLPDGIEKERKRQIKKLKRNSAFKEEVKRVFKRERIYPSDKDLFLLGLGIEMGKHYH